MKVDRHQLPAEVQREIRKILRQRFGDEFVSVRFLDIEDSDDKCMVVLEVELRPIQRAETRKLPSFFGLTRIVQQAIGSDVFPVFRPVAIDA
jgi:hypothetical protein